ncbi:MAG TPA: hypothetical protein VEY69_09570 [Lautropia sp.]|nr:hypothetical protein [Lautropia sp.]
MKARFFLHTPPGELKPVEYCDIDSDDSGRFVVARRADFNLRSRFQEEYSKFLLEQKEKGDVAVTDAGAGAASDALRLPPSLSAAIPIGREDEVRGTFAGAGTPIKTESKIAAEAAKAASPEGAQAVAKANAEKQLEQARIPATIQVENVSVDSSSPAAQKIEEAAAAAAPKVEEEKSRLLEEAEQRKEAEESAAEAAKEDAKKQAESKAGEGGSTAERLAALTADEREELQVLAKQSGMTLEEVLGDSSSGGSRKGKSRK